MSNTNTKNTTENKYIIISRAFLTTIKSDSNKSKPHSEYSRTITKSTSKPVSLTIPNYKIPPPSLAIHRPLQNKKKNLYHSSISYNHSSPS